MNLTDFFNTTADADTTKGGRLQKLASFLPGRDEVDDGINWGDTGAIDHILQGRSIQGAETTSIRGLTDKSRAAGALKLPVQAGTRVSFVANLGSVLAYEDIPEGSGTVVTVRSAQGDVTASDHGVHVQWDDGKFRAIQAEHLTLASTTNKRASIVRVRVASLGDLSSFFAPVSRKTASDSDLIHKATKDLWSFRQDNGGYVIERLFTEDGNPLKG